MPKLLDYWRDCLRSQRPAKSQALVFQQIETFCMFVGTGRSGHTLYAAMLNSHPEIVISNELNVMEYVERGMNRDQIYALILRKDHWFTKNGCNWEGYEYRVSGQWQGRFQKLKVIGDKRAAATTESFRRNPELLPKLRKTVGVPIRIIHIVRNPYDNISTQAQRRAMSLEESYEIYWNRAEANERLMKICPTEIMTIRHEEFIAQPKEGLKRLVGFLGRECDDKYLSDCGRIVNPSQSRSRLKAKWSPELIKRVQRKIDEYSFLDGYSFER